MANLARNFDSLTYSNKLRKAGVPENQANLQAQALFQILEEQLLNKQDLEKVQLKLSSEIKEVKAELGSEIKEVRSEIKDVRRDVKESELRLFVRLMTGMTIVGAILKFLPNFHL